MGASKRLAEMVLQALAHRPECPTCLTMVRFGNVLGSSGSVVPRFREQIARGGPITLTHPDVTRYFMTIPEAAQLVIQAGAMARGGDVFLLDMGEPVRIMELARRMVQLSGLRVKDDENPDGEIEILVTGLRPGEKLYEELLIDDQAERTVHPRILRAQESYLRWAELLPSLNTLIAAIDEGNPAAVRDGLARIVTGYQPAGELVDWLATANTTAQNTWAPNQRTAMQIVSRNDTPMARAAGPYVGG
jgi:FlaA1/EpsC-like NDP-sugar epimerase